MKLMNWRERESVVVHETTVLPHVVQGQSHKHDEQSPCRHHRIHPVVGLCNKQNKIMNNIVKQLLFACGKFFCDVRESLVIVNICRCEPVLKYL